MLKYSCSLYLILTIDAVSPVHASELKDIKNSVGMEANVHVSGPSQCTA